MHVVRSVGFACVLEMGGFTLVGLLFTSDLPHIKNLRGMEQFDLL